MHVFPSGQQPKLGLPSIMGRRMTAARLHASVKQVRGVTDHHSTLSHLVWNSLEEGAGYGELHGQALAYFELDKHISH